MALSHQYFAYRQPCLYQTWLRTGRSLINYGTVDNGPHLEPILTEMFLILWIWAALVTSNVKFKCICDII